MQNKFLNLDNFFICLAYDDLMVGISDGTYSLRKTGGQNVFSGTLMRSMVPECVLTTHFAKAVVSSLHVESISPSLIPTIRSSYARQMKKVSKFRNLFCIVPMVPLLTLGKSGQLVRIF